jgi:hypothetical protein
MTTSATAELVDLTAEDEEEEEEQGTCPVCGDALPVVQLREHCDAHFADDGPPADALCSCSHCGARVPLEDLESHELAHAFSSCPPRAPGAALQRAPGAAAAQRPDPQWPGPPGGAGWALIDRLAAALAAERRAGPSPPPGARAAAALLCGPVAPFGGRPGDAGEFSCVSLVGQSKQPTNQSLTDNYRNYNCRLGLRIPQHPGRGEPPPRGAPRRRGRALRRRTLRAGHRLAPGLDRGRMGRRL